MCLFHPQNTLIGTLMLGLSEINPNVSQYSQEVNTHLIECFYSHLKVCQVIFDVKLVGHGG